LYANLINLYPPMPVTTACHALYTVAQRM